jgi:hypothetical protein
VTVKSPELMLITCPKAGETNRTSETARLMRRFRA